MSRSFVWSLIIVVAPLACASAQNRESRREYETPGLVVETGARRGACDQLRFTADGQHLLATGDDKVVRVWKWDAKRGLEPAKVPALRWPTWHENRGNIYAMALSPDADNRFVAIGGQGLTLSAVAVLDRTEGTIKFATKTHTKQKPQGTLWAMAFSPKGDQVAYGDQYGGVWTWNLKDDPVRLGRHEGQGLDMNFVLHLHYLDNDRLLSVAESGQVLEWKVGAAESTERFRFTPTRLYKVALDPQWNWLAASSADPKSRYFELRSLDGKQKRFLVPPGSDEFPHSLAFDGKGQRLAVGVRRDDQGADFLKDLGNKVYVFDLTKAGTKPYAGPPMTYHPEVMAFHPTANQLAIAGGADHEVTLWNLDAMEKVSELRGPGSGLWSVALSADGTLLGYKDQRNLNASSPNDRGAGDWKVFDLQQRKFVDAEKLKVALPKNTQDGWKLHTSLPKDYPNTGHVKEEERKNGFIWFVESPQGKVFKLPLVQQRDQLPRCYVFLARTKESPTRLAVGHLWGVSLFALTETGPRLERYLTGHEGEVMGLAVSEDQRRLVTCSRDQTIAGCSLADWPSNPELGARFINLGGRIICDAVDGGSPAWEAGLTKGDELLFLAVNLQPVFNRGVAKYGKDMGTVAETLEHLAQPEPTKELYFAWRRPGENKIVEQQTSLKQRPLWRFFPTRDGEWVLWRWRDYYYDTGNQGDFLIGWQRSYFDETKTPTFHRAEQFRQEFHKPDKVAAMLKTWTVDPQAVAFPDHEPPVVKLTVVADRIKDKPLSVLVEATPRGAGENQQLARVLLWVNDHLYKEWQVDARGEFREPLVIPLESFRAGKNYLTLQAYHKGFAEGDTRWDARGQVGPQLVEYERPEPQRDLYGLFVGISDYSKAKTPLEELRAAKDAQALYDVWSKQKGKLFSNVHLEKPLVNEAATQKAILDRLEKLAKQVKPDDQLVLFLGGHGTRPKQLQEAFNLPSNKLKGLGEFLYCCADFDQNELYGTTLDFEKIYAELIKLPCHKILFLDACNSGTVSKVVGEKPSNPIRLLTRDGIGPIIFAACSPDELAIEHNTIDLGEAFGLFTAATRRILAEEEKFARADVNKNERLEPQELYAAIQAEVQRMVERLRRAGHLTPADRRQTPIAFLPTQELGLPLAAP